MVEIDGRIIRGFSWATKYLKTQIPLIARQFPEIARCHRGSINVLLDKPLRIHKPDFITREIDWGVMKEVFHFTRIRFALLPRTGRPRTHKAWIYGPQNSPHRGNVFYVEVITRKIDLGRIKRCRICIDRPHRLVPLTIIE